MPHRRTVLIGMGAVGVAIAARAVTLRARDTLELVIPVPPTAIAVEGAKQLVYEIHLADSGGAPLSPQSLRIHDAAPRGVLISEFSGEALARRHARTDESTAVIYVELSLPPASAPKSLMHTLEYTASDASKTLVVQGACAVSAAPPVIVGPPLRGGSWAAIHHPDWARGHRRVIYTIDGRARIPGRYAIDWIKLDEQGRFAGDDADVPRNHFGHGADVIAVSDAKVVAARDDMAESTTVSGNDRHSLEDAAGNYIALEIAPQRYAFYEHLQPGSVRVSAGQTVRRGEVIAALGFTGDSTGPHLHFHVADAVSTLGAEGQPFVIDRFELRGRYDDIATLGSKRWLDRPAPLGPIRREERPAANAVVAFDA
jgi:murein DD-endopeptidase